MATEAFDPGQFMSKVKGQDYLEVKWRIAWMRHEHPNADIVTDLMSHDGAQAIFRATVTIPDGGSATGWGSEVATGFENYIEKAETKAIGRALIALGYGATAVSDLDEARPSPAPSTSPPKPVPVGDGATDAQRGKIRRLASDLAIPSERMENLVAEQTGGRWASLTRRQASRMIDYLDSLRPQESRAS